MNSSFIAAGYVSDRHLPVIAEKELQRLTHINIAFGHVNEAQIVTQHLQHLNELERIRAVHPSLLILLSVGGWSAGGFSEAAATAEGRQRMAASAVEAVVTHGLDGIDLDWEYPSYGVAGIAYSQQDRHNFTLLLSGIRVALDQQGAEDGRHYLLTIAAGADQYYIDGTEMEQVQQYVDFVQLMTYDMRGGFQILTGHHTNLYTPDGDLFRISVDASVKLFQRAGVPAHKIVIGAAFYSRQWEHVPDINHGLHQMAAGSGGYGPEYTELAAEYINVNGYVRYWDEQAQAPYLYNGSTFITYDDEQSITAKCQYIVDHGLAGMMFWEYGCDQTQRLLHAMADGLCDAPS